MFVAEKGVPLAVTDVALNIVLSEAYDTAEKEMVREDGGGIAFIDARKEEIDENSTVYIDVKGKELVYRAEKNGGLVNATTGQKSGVLIELPNGPRNNAASGGEEAGDLDDEMEE
eukprot:TRINITY_DN12279_c1_g1_i2.p1 TRINITY_DN12279_c1_g1~~TRINITY_DN12279_c1_g1_i2.p1  ORF type:complete len:115 (-),score=44.34 TRINITY_DN12279_c1_g1_i2:61-405(-)